MKTTNQPKRRSHIPAIKWGVHPHRKDKRTGVISPIAPSTYMKYTLGEIERQFNKD